MLLRPILAALILAGAALPVQADVIRPLEAEQLLPERNLIRIADDLDRAVDAKAWEEVRSYFTADVFIDMSSVGGGEPGTVKADDLIAGWAEALPEEIQSFHMRSNHLVNFQTKTRAMMTSHGYAWNAGGGKLWEVWGVYEYRFERIATGWKIASFVFRATQERGERP